MMTRFMPALLLPLGLMACEPASNDEAGGIGASEARALNEAAAELDARAGGASLDNAGFDTAARAGQQHAQSRRAPQ